MTFDEKIMDAQHAFTASILALASHFNFSVTSWGRTPNRNKMVGGVANSRHLEFLAVDIVPDSREDWQPITYAAQADHLQVIAEDDHLHIQWPR